MVELGLFVACFLAGWFYRREARRMLLERGASEQAIKRVVVAGRGANRLGEFGVLALVAAAVSEITMGGEAAQTCVQLSACAWGLAFGLGGVLERRP